MIGLVIGAAALAGGFISSRDFTKRRLRFVDAVQKPAAPLIAGALATVVALPIAGLLPIITAATAIAFGVGVGGGVASGRKPPAD
jgi:hypothetical protein